MKKMILAAAFASVFAAAPALAQGATPYGPTGLRIEARGGADIVRIDVDGEDGDKTGFDYSLEAGYDFNAGGFIVGGYAGIGDSTTKACSEVFGGDRACIRSGRDITVGGRLGYSLSTNSLIFAKGGYSNGRITVGYEDPAFPADNFKAGENLDGFHLGAGVEFGLGRNAYVKGEYNYTNYSTDDGGSGFDTDLDRHRILGGVGVRF